MTQLLRCGTFISFLNVLLFPIHRIQGQRPGTLLVMHHVWTLKVMLRGIPRCRGGDIWKFINMLSTKCVLYYGKGTLQDKSTVGETVFPCVHLFPCRPPVPPTVIPCNSNSHSLYHKIENSHEPVHGTGIPCNWNSFSLCSSVSL